MMNLLGPLGGFFGRLGFTVSAGWEPHTRDVLQSEGGVFASRWPLRGGRLCLEGGGVALYRSTLKKENGP